MSHTHGYKVIHTSVIKDRYIALTKESEWASKRILENNKDSLFAFPRHISLNRCNANSAIAALYKWIRDKLLDKYVIQGLKHIFRDRLRTIECPSEIIDHLDGWSLRSIGEGCGKSYDLFALKSWMLKLS